MSQENEKEFFMRRFSSYGPVNTKLHYYAPREELIEKSYQHLMGEDSSEGGHYMTVWAPRQTGKSWIMMQVLSRFRKEGQFDVLKINLQSLKDIEDPGEIMGTIARKIGEGLGREFSGINSQDKFQEIFSKNSLEKPLVLILDEFDAIPEIGINAVVSAFRNIYLSRIDEMDKPTGDKSYLLHSVALIGVRSVLGIDNAKGSPFNIQRSLHIPNLTPDEVKGMFQWYEKESGRTVSPKVVDRLFRETNGQPGLISWFGELLTEGFEEYPVDQNKPITMRDLEVVYAAAIQALPNNNILNIISKAKEESNQSILLKMFQTDEKMEFRFDNQAVNSLYMNGVVDKEVVDFTHYYMKFSAPFVQKRLFNYFSNEFFLEKGSLVEPYESLEEVMTDTELNIPNLLKLYQIYLNKNHQWLFESAPRRNDMRIYEAMYHFNIFSWLTSFLKASGGNVYPEFPTGNGKIDLIITYGNNRYGLELKSFTNKREYQMALKQAAKYGHQLELPELYLVVFVEYIDEPIRQELEAPFQDETMGTKVVPLFIETGK
jgi:hypothetical protein